jgi:hypothetical protein
MTQSLSRGRRSGGCVPQPINKGLFSFILCPRQTSATAGTVMHGSKLALTVWFWGADPGAPGVRPRLACRRQHRRPRRPSLGSSRLRQPQNLGTRRLPRAPTPSPASLPRRVRLPLQPPPNAPRRLPNPPRHRNQDQTRNLHNVDKTGSSGTSLSKILHVIQRNLDDVSLLSITRRPNW